MKRLTLLAVFGIMSSLWAGCPIYDEDPGQGGGPPACTQENCNPVGKCNSSIECGINETCGQDNFCHTGDCTVWGCSGGLSCVIASDFTASCQPGSAGTTSSSSSSGSGGSTSSSSSSTGSSSSSSGAPPIVYCGNPDDCAAGETCAPNGTCQVGTCSMIGCIYGFTCGLNGCYRTDPLGCGADIDCMSQGNGYACVSGKCTQPADQCSDQTQCMPGNKCVSGKCIMACTSSVQCGTGYSCDTAKGVCTLPAASCTITNDCGSADKVCVDGACVPRSAGGSCPAGEVWVDNGCIPNQTPVFTCNQDGMQDVCMSGSICLHHNCYISCADPNGAVCNNFPPFNVCKMVTTSSGTHEVCGSNSNLGNECDPTNSMYCAPGKVCIDGYCK